MKKKKVYHSEQFKLKVVLEALKGLKTQQQIAAEFGVHPVQVTQWKTLLVENAAAIFSKGQSKKKEKEEVDFAQLFEKIGRLETENDWLKKNWNAELGRKTADD